MRCCKVSVVPDFYLHILELLVFDMVLLELFLMFLVSLFVCLFVCLFLFSHYICHWNLCSFLRDVQYENFPSKAIYIFWHFSNMIGWPMTLQMKLQPYPFSGPWNVLSLVHTMSCTCCCNNLLAVSLWLIITGKSMIYEITSTETKEYNSCTELSYIEN